MSEKIKEIDFEELWAKVHDMREKIALADEACTLLDKLYDMSEFAVEFDGDLREFVKEKIDQKSYEHLTWAMLDHMLGTLRIIFEEERPMSLTGYEVLKGDIHAIKLGINKEKALKEEKSK